MVFCLGRAFNLDEDINISNITMWLRKRHKIGMKASTAEAGKYTQEAGVLAYYEVILIVFILLISFFFK